MEEVRGASGAVGLHPDRPKGTLQDVLGFDGKGRAYGVTVAAFAMVLTQAAVRSVRTCCDQSLFLKISPVS